MRGLLVGESETCLDRGGNGHPEAESSSLQGIASSLKQGSPLRWVMRDTYFETSISSDALLHVCMSTKVWSKSGESTAKGNWQFDDEDPRLIQMAEKIRTKKSTDEIKGIPRDIAEFQWGGHNAVPPLRLEHTCVSIVLGHASKLYRPLKTTGMSGMRWCILLICL